jgi:hypothetical protein
MENILQGLDLLNYKTGPNSAFKKALHFIPLAQIAQKIFKAYGSPRNKYNSNNSPSNWINFHWISQELGLQLRRDIISKMFILAVSNTHWGMMAYLTK